MDGHGPSIYIMWALRDSPTSYRRRRFERGGAASFQETCCLGLGLRSNDQLIEEGVSNARWFMLWSDSRKHVVWACGSALVVSCPTNFTIHILATEPSIPALLHCNSRHIRCALPHSCFTGSICPSTGRRRSPGSWTWAWSRSGTLGRREWHM